MYHILVALLITIFIALAPECEHEVICLIQCDRIHILRMHIITM